MVKFLKVMAAAVAALGLLVLNLPFTSLDVSAEEGGYEIGLYADSNQAFLCEAYGGRFTVRDGDVLTNGSTIGLESSITDDMSLNIVIDNSTIATLKKGGTETVALEHTVIFDNITADETGKNVYVRFTTGWQYTITSTADVEVTFVDASGNAIKPCSMYPNNENIETFSFPYTISAYKSEESTDGLAIFGFREQPAKALFKAKDGYAIVFVGNVNTESTIATSPLYDFVYDCSGDTTGTARISVSGVPYDGNGIVYYYADTISGATISFDGLSEDEAKKYVLEIIGFSMDDFSEEDLALFNSLIEDSDYEMTQAFLGYEMRLFYGDKEIHTPPCPIKITLKLKKALDIDDGSKVLIYHLDYSTEKVEIIEATYNASDLTLSFVATSFSPYYVMGGTLKAKPVTQDSTTTPAAGETTTPAADSSTTPATGNTQTAVNTPAASVTTPAADATTTTSTPTPTPAPIVKTGEDLNLVSIVAGSLLILAAGGMVLLSRKESFSSEK